MKHNDKNILISVFTSYTNKEMWLKNPGSFSTICLSPTHVKLSIEHDRNEGTISQLK